MTPLTEQYNTLQQGYPEFTRYMDAHSSIDTIHHANGIVSTNEDLQQRVVEYWIQQLLQSPKDIHHHPDVLFINPEGRHITRQDCVSLIPWVYTKPQHSPFRIVHIVGAHRLNASTTNSLLKLIEEPPAHTVVFLTTHTPYGFPATIRSRVQWFWIPHTTKNTYNDRHYFWIDWLQKPIVTRDTLLQETFIHASTTKALHQLPEHLATLQELFRDMILILTNGKNSAPQGTASIAVSDIAKRYTVGQLIQISATLLDLERMCAAQVNKKNIIDYLIVAL